MKEPSLSDLFKAFGEKQEKESHDPAKKLSGVNITTSFVYSFSEDKEGRIVFQLDDMVFYLKPKDSLYVEEDRVFINNRPAKNQASALDDDALALIDRTPESHPDTETEPEDGKGLIIDRLPQYSRDERNYRPSQKMPLMLLGIRKPEPRDFWDKNKILAIYKVKDKRNHTFEIRVLQENRLRTYSAVPSYGGLDIYSPRSQYRPDKIFDFIQEVAYQFHGFHYTEPFYDGETIVMLGKRYVLSANPEDKENPDCFYVPYNRHPLEIFKKAFFHYLLQESRVIGNRMNLRLDGYMYRLSSYRSIFASNDPGKRILCFDYRNFCFRKDYLDALITHELAHCYIHPHSKAFYALCEQYCKDYRYKDYCFSHGIFNDDDLSEDDLDSLNRDLIEKHRIRRHLEENNK